MVGNEPPIDPGGQATKTTVQVTATSNEGGSCGGPKKMRTFAEIIAEEKEQRNILEIKLTRLSINVEGELKAAKSLSIEEVGELMFDVIKLKPEDCAGVAMYSSRYDTKEVKLKAGVNPAPYLPPSAFMIMR